MEWRVGLALLFLLVLLFSVLHLAYSTMPARHTPPPRDSGGLPGLSRGPVSPEYGRIGYRDQRTNVEYDSTQRFATMNNFRPMDESYKKVAPAFKFTMDASGNVVLPY